MHLYILSVMSAADGMDMLALCSQDRVCALLEEAELEAIVETMEYFEFRLRDTIGIGLVLLSVRSGWT